MTLCKQWFNATDAQGDDLPFIVYFEVFEKKADGRFSKIGEVSVAPGQPRYLYLTQGVEYKFVQIIEIEGWTIPSDKYITACDVDVTFIYTKDAPEGAIRIGDTRTIDGHSFKLLDIVCGTNASIRATIDGVTSRIPLVAVAGVLVGSMPTVGIAVGGLFVAVKMVGTACDTILVEGLAMGGLTPDDQQANEDRAQEEYIYPDGTKPTPEEVKEADDKAEENIANWLNDEYVEMVRRLTAGEITRVALARWLQEEVYQLKLVTLGAAYYVANFSLEIPTFVMAGEVQVSGTAPQPNQDLQIMGVKKLFGFDWLATDTELAKVTSDADYKYKATLTLDEFGIIEVYSRIPKEWWQVLDKDVTTPRHTVFVMTWAMLLFLIIAAALVYDKSSGGKLRKMLKKR